MYIVFITFIYMAYCNINAVYADESPAVSMDHDGDTGSTSALSALNGVTIDYHDDETINVLTDGTALSNQLTASPKKLVTANRTHSRDDNINYSAKCLEVQADSNSDNHHDITLIFFRKVEITHSDNLALPQQRLQLKRQVPRRLALFTHFLIMSTGVKPIRHQKFDHLIINPTTINDQYLFKIIDQLVGQYLYAVNFHSTFNNCVFNSVFFINRQLR